MHAYSMKQLQFGFVQSRSSWLTFLKLLYVLAFFFLFVMTLATAYGLSHPELGLVEADPLVRAYMAEYGLAVALLIVILVNSSVLIVSWLFFTLYRMIQRRYHWHSPLIDSIAYSLVTTFGLYALIAWLLNASNDVYVLLFHSDPHLLAATLELWTSTTGCIMLTTFLLLLLILYARSSVHKEKF